MDVLVVDSDASVRSYIADLIQRWGYKAEKAETGQDTLKKAMAKE